MVRLDEPPRVAARSGRTALKMQRSDEGKCWSCRTAGSGYRYNPVPPVRNVGNAIPLGCRTGSDEDPNKITIPMHDCCLKHVRVRGRMLEGSWSGTCADGRNDAHDASLFFGPRCKPTQRGYLMQPGLKPSRPLTCMLACWRLYCGGSL